MATLIVIALILGGGYLVSLRIHPLKRCPMCKATGLDFGSVYGYAHRRCRACGGTGGRTGGHEDLLRRNQKHRYLRSQVIHRPGESPATTITLPAIRN